MTGFEAPNHINPGPGDYGRKRMFDNKIVVDYSKKSGGYATAMGFNNNSALSMQSSLGRKPRREARFHSPSEAETKKINKIIDNQISATAQNVNPRKKQKKDLNGY